MQSSSLNRLLKMAVLAGVETAVHLHINRGDDLDARDDAGMTPLMLAASKNKGKICSLLISSGADASLLAPSGRDALAIAMAAGALLAVKAIEAFAPKHETDTEPGGGHADPHYSSNESTEVSGDDKYLFDVSGWEAEEDAPVPEGDETLTEAAAVIHLAISSHKPINHFEDWADFEAFLPERTTPLVMVAEEEGRKGIKRLLLWALREGSVPERDVKDLCANEDGSRNEEGEALVRLALGDLGAEIDERIETENPVSDCEEGERYEVDVAEALAFLDNLGSGSNEPMRFFAKNMRGINLLTAEEETFLARAMEEGKVSALDALAAWPEGVAAVLAAADRVRAGEGTVETISAGGCAEPSEDDSEGFSTEQKVPEEEGDEHENSDYLSFAAREFLERIVTVQNLEHHAGKGGLGEKALRSALDSAHLTTRFLTELALSVKNEGTGLAGSLMQAVALYSQARERMVVSNLRLVISFVKRYQGQGLTFDDLVQEGNIGLMKAVDRYDWRKGFRFSTYATWWIRQQASRAVADFGRTIRIPVHVHEKMFGITREAAQMERLNGRTPSAQAVAERLSLPPGRVAALLARAEEPVSLHEPDSAGNTLAANLIDPAAPDPYVAAERTSLIKTVKAVLAEFDQRTVEVITLRFGLDGSDSRTLEETGMHFGVTRERIRQIEAKALRKFAHPSRAEVLLDFLDNAPPVKFEKEAEYGEVWSEPVLVEKWPRGRPSKRFVAEVATAPPDGVTKAISMARRIGAHVEDDRRTGGEVVISLSDGKDAQTRKLARTLLASGFIFWPGLGYRK